MIIQINYTGAILSQSGPGHIEVPPCRPGPWLDLTRGYGEPLGRDRKHAVRGRISQLQHQSPYRHLPSGTHPETPS
jgi:hypothetical protein